jgi:anti-sigma regulatory factor (Ser/Thr protein kinase)
MAATELQDIANNHGDHLVTFYEHDADLVAAVVPYLAAGINGDEVTVVIATEAHRRAFETALHGTGVDVALAQANGSFLALEAESTLARIALDGQIDRDAFHEVVGGLMRRALASGRPLRAFGEMVALLWDAGAVLAAIELEGLWNELGRELEFSLFCAYSSASVVGHEHAEALQQVCRMHCTVVQQAGGGVADAGQLSPRELTASFPAERESPGRARRLAASELRHWGHDEDLVSEAALVLSELASNAVIHAGSPFTISLQFEGSLLRIAVRDRCPVPATTHGDGGLLVRAPHGLAVIQALSAQWGVENALDGTGKVVWAELRVA